VADVIGLMDELSIARAAIMGFSLGAGLAARLSMAHPDRVTALIMAGVGGRLLTETQDASAMAQAMETPDPASIVEPFLRSFRSFADEQGEDRLALAACARASRPPPSAAEFGALRVRTLVVAGAQDELAGDPQELAAVTPGAEAVSLPGCDHFSAIAHALHKAAVFDFLETMMD